MRNKIKQYRLAFGLSQRKLAEMIGASQAAISQWEAGTSDPYPPQMQDLAIAFGVSIESVFPYYKPFKSAFEKKPRNISTMDGLRHSAHIRMGEDMIVRVNVGQARGSGTDDGEVRFLRGKVVQVMPCWFRVQTEKGWSICVHYQEFLTDRTVRRATK